MSEEGAPIREQKTDYFANLSIADIYGKWKVPLGTEIITDIPWSVYCEWDKQPQQQSDLRKRELMERYQIPSIAAYGSGSEKQKIYGVLVLHPGPTPVLTHWAPSYEERKLLAQLSLALASSSRPYIVDFGCGTGFLSKLLASDNLARILGVEIDAKQIKGLPKTEGDVEFIQGNIYDVWRLLRPDREPGIQNKVGEIIDEITLVLSRYAEQYSSRRRFHNMDFGPKGLFAKRLKKLNLTAKLNLGESPVDLAICSFMEVGVEMTIPIRDGILPKCIVYARPLNGNSGVTDYYYYLDNLGIRADKLKNWVSSYNPGRNYRTVARWPTIWEDNWRTLMHGFSSSIGAEIIIQLRKDVSVEDLPDIEVEHYPWDEEIEEIMRRPDVFMLYTKDQDYGQNFANRFQNAIHLARKNLSAI